MDFKKSFKILFKNKNFLLLLFAFSFLNGTFNFLGTLMNLIVKPFNYTDVIFVVCRMKQVILEER